MADAYRRRRDRRRSRGLSRSAARRAERPQGRLRGRVEESRRQRRARRHLPERGVHPFEGDARIHRAGISRAARICRCTASGRAASRVDLAAMQKRRASIVRSMSGGVAGLFKSAGVTADRRPRQAAAGHRVEVTAHDGSKSEICAKQVVLASGSVPTELKSMPFDHEYIVDSWDALELTAVPKRLCVIGAGVIGLELGSVWSRLGAKVIILEALDNFLAIADQQLATEAARHFKKQGLDIRLGARSPARRSPMAPSPSSTPIKAGAQHAGRRQGHRRRRAPSLHEGSARAGRRRHARRAWFHQGR